MSDKTEAPTPRRLRKALEEGDSGASAQASQAVAFLVAVALAPALGAAADLAHLAGRAAPALSLAAIEARALAWRVAIAGLAFGAIDLVVMRRAWIDRLKMTRAEVQREHKDAEGDPHLKAARARAHQEVLAQATLTNVRQASVVVVNPTHLACALRYDAGGGDEAPVVVASGEGDFAARIVEAAREAGVPVVRDVPLARALVELEAGDTIPEALYQAVAEILREIWDDAEPRPDGEARPPDEPR